MIANILRFCAVALLALGMGLGYNGYRAYLKDKADSRPFETVNACLENVKSLKCMEGK